MYEKWGLSHIFILVHVNCIAGHFVTYDFSCHSGHLLFIDNDLKDKIQL